MIDSNHNMHLLPMEALEEAAACLKVMAHPVRLRIADILMQGDLTVREIAETCGVREHQVCEHLRLMQSYRLLTSERRGRTVHYRVVSPQLPALLGCVREHCNVEGANS
ncbi:MAG: metalloregulator ArsR/SmtB family transcription factor [Armatimonadetes bacterium]|nr:metalloregulator ArsR/SmtB family transcription factor [Armatimonadota bacterium]